MSNEKEDKSIDIAPNSILKQFLERFTSPLFGSFVIAWLIFNWQVPVVLFFYKFENLKVDNYTSYSDAINKIVTGHNAFLWPTISALLYTLAYPFFKVVVASINTLSVKATNWTVRKAGKGSYVKTEDILEQETLYSQKIKQAEAVIKGGKEKDERIAKLSNEKNELTAALNLLNSNIDILKAKWSIRFQSPSTIWEEPVSTIQIEANILTKFTGNSYTRYELILFKLTPEMPNGFRIQMCFRIPKASNHNYPELLIFNIIPVDRTLTTFNYTGSINSIQMNMFKLP